MPFPKKSLLTALGVLAVTVPSAGAFDLKTQSWPLTDRTYEKIDWDSVRIDPYIPETVWLKRTAEMNNSLSANLDFEPVASIDVTRYYTEETIPSSDLLIKEAQRAAARVGANLVFVDHRLMLGEELDGIRFIAYRVEYKERLVSPTYLAALPQITVNGDFLDNELRRWNKAQFGNLQPPDQLVSVKSGTPVRIVLKDGSDVKGAFYEVDDDNRVWIQVSGWTRFFRDRAISTHAIRSFSVVSESAIPATVVNSLGERVLEGS